ncbi:MAG: NUDIX hydrolase [Patescibacteria group bacterium]
MPQSHELFQISQVAILIRNDKCLILKCADRDNEWVLPGGRIDKDETMISGNCEPAFRRELLEELNLRDVKILGVVDYDHVGKTRITKDCVLGVANLIVNDNDEITLSEEHIELQWVTINKLDKYNFVWPCAKRMIIKGFEYKKLLENYVK